MRNDNDEFDFNELDCDMATEYIEEHVDDVCEMWNKYCDEEGSDWDKFYKFDDLAEMFPKTVDFLRALPTDGSFYQSEFFNFNSLDELQSVDSWMDAIDEDERIDFVRWLMNKEDEI